MVDEVQEVDIVGVPESFPSVAGAVPLAETSNIDNVRNLPPKTTAEQDLKSAGQREINLIWETTQRHIALFVVVVGCTVSATVVVYSVVKGSTTDPLVLAAFTLLSNICFLVAGFYFGRTNHARIGDDKMSAESGTMDTR